MRDADFGEQGALFHGRNWIGIIFDLEPSLVLLEKASCRIVGMQIDKRERHRLIWWFEQDLDAADFCREIDPVGIAPAIWSIALYEGCMY